jgi:Ca2+/H+ antiporter
MSTRTHLVLLLLAHLLLAGLLLGAVLCLLLGRPGSQQFDLAAAGAALAPLLLAWAGALLVRQLWRRRWVGAGALAVLALFDGLAWCGGWLLMATAGAVPGPN